MQNSTLAPPLQLSRINNSHQFEFLHNVGSSRNISVICDRILPSNLRGKRPKTINDMVENYTFYHTAIVENAVCVLLHQMINGKVLFRGTQHRSWVLNTDRTFNHEILACKVRPFQCLYICMWKSIDETWELGKRGIFHAFTWVMIYIYILRWKHCWENCSQCKCKKVPLSSQRKELKNKQKTFPFSLWFHTERKERKKTKTKTKPRQVKSSQWLYIYNIYSQFDVTRTVLVPIAMDDRLGIARLGAGRDAERKHITYHTKNPIRSDLTQLSNAHRPSPWHANTHTHTHTHNTE